MVEHPTLFKGEMIRAIQANLKRQTRRLITHRTAFVDGERVSKEWFAGLDFSDAYVDRGPSPAGNPGPYLKVARPSDGTRHRVYPQWQVGDLLWCKETWRPRIIQNSAPDACDIADVLITYAADGEERYFLQGEIPDDWTIPKVAHRANVTPLFMPKWATRLWLEVTEVRIQRLHEISEEDALAEGVVRVRDACHVVRGSEMDLAGLCHTSAVTAFQGLWDEINADRSPWERNDWVFALSFKRVERRAEAA